MARVTIEDCLVHVENRFALVHVATKRAKQLSRENKKKLITTESRNREIIQALREIELGKTKERK